MSSSEFRPNTRRLEGEGIFPLFFFLAPFKSRHLSEAIQRGSVSGEADWEGQNQHSGSAEGPKRAALPPQRGQRDLRLTGRARRASVSGEGEAQNGNSG